MVKQSISSAAMVGLMSVFLACVHDESSLEQRIGASHESDTEITEVTQEDQINQHADQYQDQLVKMTGRVVAILSPHAFQLNLGGEATAHQVMVLNATGYEIPLRVQDQLEVIGTVRLLGGMQIDEQIKSELLAGEASESADRPVLMANQVIGHWATKRPVAQRVAYGQLNEIDGQMIPKESTPEVDVSNDVAMGVHDEAVDGAFFSDCQLRVFYKTAGAVGNPCASTEEYAASILSEQQLELFHRYQDTAGRQVAH